MTKRQAEIVELLVEEGMTDAEIARKLSISRSTVSTHFDAIRLRLGVHSRAAIVAWYLKTTQRGA